MDIFKLMRENGYLSDMLDYKDFEWDDKNKKMCYLRGDVSGRDFYDYIPLVYMTEDEWEKVVDSMIDDYGFDDYDWGDVPIEEVEDYLYENLRDILIDEAQKME